MRRGREHNTQANIQDFHPIRMPQIAQTYPAIADSVSGGLQLFRRRREPQYLHNSIPSPLAHNHALIPPHKHLPHALARLRQLPHQRPSISIKQLHTPIIPTCNEVVRVDLEGGDAVVVRADAQPRGVGFEREDNHAAVGAAGDEVVVEDLNVPDERGVALQQSQAFP